jgi:hypothetical protein
MQTQPTGTIANGLRSRREHGRQRRRLRPSALGQLTFTNEMKTMFIFDCFRSLAQGFLDQYDAPADDDRQN